MKLILAFLMTIGLSNYSLSQNNLWQSVSSAFNREVDVMYNDTMLHKLIIAGQFRLIINGDTIYHITAWDGEKFDSLGLGINRYPGTLSSNLPNLQAICRYKDKLYVGGGFDKAGSIKHNYLFNGIFLASWNGTEWDTTGLQVNGFVMDIKVFNDTMYICGNFTLINNIQIFKVAMFDGNSWHSLEFPIENAFAAGLQFYHGDLYVSGYFYDSMGHQHQMMVRHNGVWNFMGQDLNGGADWSDKMVIYNDQLILSGYFYQSWGNADNNIMAWDGIQWYPMGGGTNGGDIRDLFLYNNKVYAIGTFSTAGGVPASKAAVWDGQKWCGFGGTFNNGALAGAFYQDTLYIGGGFNMVDNDSVFRLAKYTGGNMVDTCGVISNVNEITSELQCSLTPNPATTQLQINLPTPTQPQHLKLITPLGQTIQQQIFSTNQLQLDISALPVGVYFIEMQNEKGRAVKKFVKE